jgi:flagellar basal body-associated protein FliL
MRKKTTLVAIIVVLLLLALGWLFFDLLNGNQPLLNEDDGFRTWFWEKRGLDLIVQVILVFAGALGIAAILPVEDENG